MSTANTRTSANRVPLGKSEHLDGPFETREADNPFELVARWSPTHPHEHHLLQGNDDEHTPVFAFFPFSSVSFRYVWSGKLLNEADAKVRQKEWGRTVRKYTNVLAVAEERTVHLLRIGGHAVVSSLLKFSVEKVR